MNNCNTHIDHGSRSTGNLPMKFDRLIEYNMRKVFLEKWYIKCGGETIPRPFCKKVKIEHISGSTVFITYEVEDNKIKLKLRCRALAFTLYKALKKRSGTSLPVLFSAWFLKKNVFLVIFYYLHKFHYLVVFACEILVIEIL